MLCKWSILDMLVSRESRKILTTDVVFLLTILPVQRPTQPEDTDDYVGYYILPTPVAASPTRHTAAPSSPAVIPPASDSPDPPAKGNSGEVGNIPAEPAPGLRATAPDFVPISTPSAFENRGPKSKSQKKKANRNGKKWSESRRSPIHSQEWRNTVQEDTFETWETRDITNPWRDSTLTEVPVSESLEYQNAGFFEPLQTQAHLSTSDHHTFISPTPWEWQLQSLVLPKQRASRRSEYPLSVEGTCNEDYPSTSAYSDQHKSYLGSSDEFGKEDFCEGEGHTTIDGHNGAECENSKQEGENMGAKVDASGDTKTDQDVLPAPTEHPNTTIQLPSDTARIIEHLPESYRPASSSRKSLDIVKEAEESDNESTAEGVTANKAEKTTSLALENSNDTAQSEKEKI